MSKELNTLRNEINKKVVGQDNVVRALLIGLLTDDNILLEGYDWYCENSFG